MIGERAIAGRRTDQRREDSSDEERWRSPFAGHTHTGQHRSSTQPANFAKVKQIAVLHVDLVNYIVPGSGGESSCGRGWSTRRRIISLTKPAFFGWGFTGRIAMFGGRTLGLHGPEVARPCGLHSDSLYCIGASSNPQAFTRGHESAYMSETEPKWFVVETACYAFVGRIRHLAKVNVNKVNTLIILTIVYVYLLIVGIYRNWVTNGIHVLCIQSTYTI